MFEAKSDQFDAGETVSGISPQLEPSPRSALARLHSDELLRLPPAERLTHLRDNLEGPIVFTHGFGIEGQLIFHWICEHDIDIDVVTLDTGRLFPETYELWAATERRYARRIRAVYPHNLALEKLVAKQGIDGIFESRRGSPAVTSARSNRSIALWGVPRPGSRAYAPTRVPFGATPA